MSPAWGNLPVIMIGQQQRCGGSLLVRLFDSHPNLLVHPAENYSGRPYKYHFPQVDARATAEQLWDYVSEYPLYLAGRAGYLSSERRQAFTWSYSVRRHRRMFLENLRQIPHDTRQVLQAYFESLFLAIRSVHRPALPKYYAYFTPRQCLYAEEFFDSFPDGHIIQVVRHPAAYYNSVKSHNRYYDLETCKALWRIFFLRALDASTNGWARYHVVFFEELVSEPERVLRQLCAKMDLPFHPSLRTPTFNGMAWGGNSHFGALRGVARDVSDQYKKSLTPHEIASFKEEMHWYDELPRLLHASAGVGNGYRQPLQRLDRYLACYKQEKPYDTSGIPLENPAAYFDLLGTRAPETLDYWRLVSAGERATFYATREVPRAIVLSSPISRPVSMEFMKRLSDPVAAASVVVNAWLLERAAGIRRAVRLAVREGQFTREALLEGILFHITRDPRAITMQFHTHLTAASGRGSASETRWLNQIRQQIKTGPTGLIRRLQSAHITHRRWL